jgi:hypothetical protein
MLSLAGPIQNRGPDLAFDLPSGASNSRRSVQIAWSGHRVGEAPSLSSTQAIN